MGNLAWWGVIKAGWPVLTVLLGMSVVTLAVAWEKWKSFARIQIDSRPFIESVKKAGDSAKVVSFCEKSDQPLAYITRVIYKTTGRREDKERNLARAIQQLVHQLEGRISVLGTIASIAPFVGLLGTVIGIIKSFRAVSMSSAGGAGLVALGIAEALVGTAAGLVVAIPAVLFYNYFVNKLRRLTQDWEIAGGDIIDMAGS